MALLGRPLDEALNTAFLSGRDQRPDVVLVVIGQVVFQPFDGAREIGDEIVVDFLAGIDAARGGAILTGVVIAEYLHALDDRRDIRVVEHDDRCLAAEFEMRALDVSTLRPAAPSGRFRCFPSATPSRP